MEDEKIIEPATEPTTENNYIEQIKKLKESTVDRSAYEKVIAENKQLTQALVDGNYATAVKAEPDVSIEDLAKGFLTGNHTNLDYISNALKYRQAVLDKYGEDVFVSQDPTKSPTEADYATASRIAETLQGIVDYANGNADVFQSELQRVLVDPVIPSATRHK